MNSKYVLAIARVVLLFASGPIGEDQQALAFGEHHHHAVARHSHTFVTTGAFSYFCQLHPTMLGKVVVTKYEHNSTI